MSTDPHASDVPGHADAVAHHATDDHGDDHGHDDHAHGEEPSGRSTSAPGVPRSSASRSGLVTAAGFVIATTRRRPSDRRGVDGNRAARLRRPSGTLGDLP